MDAMPTARETAPPGLPARSTPIVTDSSFILCTGNPREASSEEESAVLISRD